jgi:DNA primase
MDAITEIKELLDIEEIFESGDLALKRVKPGEWKANCPFHADKSPSFFISEYKKVYYCFGCGAKGSLVDLYSFFNNMSFGDAIRDLASKYGVSLGEEDNQKKEMIRQLNKVQQGLIKHARKSDLYRNFLENRHIPIELAYEAELGYWPIGIWWKRNDEVSLKELQDLGLANSVKALLEMRMTFPIKNWQGDIISFAGREIQSHNKTTNKYINGYDSLLYHKSKTFYGTPISNSRNKVIISEGYFDQIAIANLGYDSLAVCGTAFTRSHAAYLRNRDEVVLLFDNDPAGVGARTEATKALFSEGIPVKWGYVPVGKDPLDCWIADKDKLRRGIETAKDPFEYIITILKKPNSIEQKKKAWEVAQDLASYIKDPFEVAKAMEQVNYATAIVGLPIYIPSTPSVKEPRLEQGLLEQAEGALMYQALAAHSLILPSEWPIADPDFRMAYAKLIAGVDVTDIDPSNKISKLFSKYDFTADTTNDEIIVALSKAWLHQARNKWGYEENAELTDQLDVLLAGAEDHLIESSTLEDGVGDEIIKVALALRQKYLGVSFSDSEESEIFVIENERDASILCKLVSEDMVPSSYLDGDVEALELLAVSCAEGNDSFLVPIFEKLLQHKSPMAFAIIRKISSREQKHRAISMAKEQLVNMSR